MASRYSWATDPTDFEEPTEQKKALGWLEGEPPAAKHFNWMLNAAFTQSGVDRLVFINQMFSSNLLLDHEKRLQELE